MSKGRSGIHAFDYYRDLTDLSVLLLPVTLPVEFFFEAFFAAILDYLQDYPSLLV